MGFPFGGFPFGFPWRRIDRRVSVGAIAVLFLVGACSGAEEATSTATMSDETPVATLVQEPTKSVGLVLPTLDSDDAAPSEEVRGGGQTEEGSLDQYDPMDPDVQLGLPNDITQSQMDDWMNYHDTALATSEECSSLFGAEMTEIGPGHEAFDVFPFEVGEGQTLWIVCTLPGYILDAGVPDTGVNPIFEEGMNFTDFQALPTGGQACFVSYNPSRVERGFRVMPIEISQIDGYEISYIAQGENRKNGSTTMGLQASSNLGAESASWSPYAFVLPDCSLM